VTSGRRLRIAKELQRPVVLGELAARARDGFDQRFLLDALRFVLGRRRDMPAAATCWRMSAPCSTASAIRARLSLIERSSDE
jgi:hypothetical protein